MLVGRVRLVGVFNGARCTRAACRYGAFIDGILADYRPGSVAGSPPLGDGTGSVTGSVAGSVTNSPLGDGPVSPGGGRHSGGSRGGRGHGHGGHHAGAGVAGGPVMVAVCGFGSPIEAKKDPDNNRCR